MKISDIRLFINKLEGALQLLGFDVVKKEDCFIASHDGEKVLIIPYFENVEFEIPKEILNVKKVIISNSKLDSSELRVYSLRELEYLIENREKLGEVYAQIIDMLFFGNSFIPIIDFMINKKPFNVNQKTNDIDDLAAKKTETSTSDNKVDISIVEKALSIKLEKKTKYYANADFAVVGIISKLYPTGNYWYGYHDYQIKILKTFKNAFMAFYF